MYSNKHNTVLFLMLLSLAGVYATCHKHLDCRETFYNFEIGIKAYPDKDSINVGDTLWLEVNEPTTLKDVQTSNIVNFSGAANLGTTIGIGELISANNIDNKGTLAFRFILKTGSYIPHPDTTTFREYGFLEENGGYKFKLGIISQKKGVYKVFVSNATSVVRKNDNCTKASFEINFKSTDQHLYFNEIVLPGVTLPPGGGVYLFKVK